MNSDFKKKRGSADWKEKKFYVNSYALFALSYLITNLTVFSAVFMIIKCI